MDLFHSISQSIDKVLTCDFYDSFRTFKMSDKMMQTEPGGQSTQYESIKTVTSETAKQQGQLGGRANTGSLETWFAKANGEADQTLTSMQEPSVSAERGEKTAENMRYGQAISESGLGGQTTTSEGVANQGGFGGAEAQEEKMKNTRREQGYSGGNDVGA